MQTSVVWMGLQLSSPYVLASLTLFSHTNLSAHIRYYTQCAQQGAGAIVLPSLNPARDTGPNTENRVKVRAKAIESGLQGMMGFTVLGPTDPNIISVPYAVALAQAVTNTKLGIPVIGSISNLGSLEQFDAALIRLVQAGVDGIELNFSCPNALTEHGAAPDDSNLVRIQHARSICGKLPISLKLSPMLDYRKLLSSISDEIQSLTLSNAYIGLCPPELELSHQSPFDECPNWAPSGMYGPQERMFTYYSLYKMSTLAASNNWDIACVGGMVSFDHTVQALLLGATCVQLSSTIAWYGMGMFHTFKASLSQYMNKKGISSVQNLQGQALPFIHESADHAMEGIWVFRTMKVTDRCLKCSSCACTQKLCIAITQAPGQAPVIDSTLCSGCGWCQVICINHAIAIDEASSLPHHVNSPT